VYVQIANDIIFILSVRHRHHWFF